MKNHVVSVAISEKQFDRWKQMAEKKDMTLSAFIRYCVENYLSLMEKYEQYKKK